jgi:hypothetical protein
LTEYGIEAVPDDHDDHRKAPKEINELYSRLMCLHAWKPRMIIRDDNIEVRSESRVYSPNWSLMSFSSSSRSTGLVT